MFESAVDGPGVPSIATISTASRYACGRSANHVWNACLGRPSTMSSNRAGWSHLGGRLRSRSQTCRGCCTQFARNEQRGYHSSVSPMLDVFGAVQRDNCVVRREHQRESPDTGKGRSDHSQTKVSAPTLVHASSITLKGPPCPSADVERAG